jgi:hypothetical protein
MVEEIVVMKTRIVLLLGALSLLTGCGGLPYSDPYGASPETSAKYECERAGGSWHSRTAVCEYPRR